MSKTILSFDIGKRDFAFCLFTAQFVNAGVTSIEILEWAIMDIRSKDEKTPKYVELGKCVDNLCLACQLPKVQAAIAKADVFAIESQYRNPHMFAIQHSLQSCLRLSSPGDLAFDKPVLYISAKGKFADAQRLGFKLKYDTSRKATRRLVPKPTVYMVRKMVKENSVDIVKQLLDKFKDIGMNSSWAVAWSKCKAVQRDDFSDSLLVGLAAICHINWKANG